MDEDEELNKTMESSTTQQVNTKSKANATKKPRGRPRKTRLLVKRQTLRSRLNTTKQPKKTQINLNNVNKTVVKVQ